MKNVPVFSNGMSVGHRSILETRTKAFGYDGSYLGEYDANLGFTMDEKNRHYSDGDATVGLVVGYYYKNKGKY